MPHTSKKAKRVGIWIRVSTEDQAQGESPEHHEKRARYYAEAKEWNIKEVYHLEAVSGKSVITHPEAKRMLEDIKTGHITGLIFSKLARLARNTRELLEFSDLFRDYNADLISLQEAIDTTSPAGRLFYTMIAAMAQWEREEISDRVLASIPIRAKLGKHLGGSAPFGYQYVDKKLVPDPKEAPIRKLIYDLFLEHKRKKTVARILHDMGHRTRSGADFSDTSITRLLRNSSAKGLRRANFTKTVDGKSSWQFKPEDEWVYIKVEPVVSEEIWNRCNQILDERERTRKPPAKKVVQLFTGIAFCTCGTKMYVPSNSPKYTCYKCRNKISVDDLESVFHEQLKSFFFSSEEIADHLNQADSVLIEKGKLLEVLIKEQKEIKRNIDKLYDLYLADEIAKEGFGYKYNPMEERRKQLEDEIPRLQGEIDFLKIQYLSSDEIISEAKDLYTRWPSMDFKEKREVVENITEDIKISKAEVVINLCYLPSPSEMVTERQRHPTDEEVVITRRVSVIKSPAKIATPSPSHRSHRFICSGR